MILIMLVVLERTKTLEFTLLEVKLIFLEEKKLDTLLKLETVMAILLLQVLELVQIQ